MLGFNVGGGRGSGVSMGKGCLLEGDLMPPFEAGDSGMKDCGKEWKPADKGCACSGFGRAAIDMDRGDGGGDGVVEVERNVGPRGVDVTDEGVFFRRGESLDRSGIVRSIGCDIGRAVSFLGWG